MIRVVKEVLQLQIPEDRDEDFLRVYKNEMYANFILLNLGYVICCLLSLFWFHDLDKKESIPISN